MACAFTHVWLAMQMHKFMANLTEAVYEVRGHTVLYLPAEDLQDAKASSKDRDLVQRLESTIIHWTRQIKGVVNQQVLARC
jgi:dynein heavy chain, axonemal